MSKVYVCEQLNSFKNIYGGYDCKKWVLEDISSSSSVFDSLSLTYSQAQEVSLLILGFFVAYVIFAVTAKGINLL